MTAMMLDDIEPSDLDPIAQKLRGADQTASFGFDRIMEIATASRGTDPYGYRSEFLSLVRLASALGSGNR